MMATETVNRRKYLRRVAAVGGVGLAGCTGGDDQETTGTTETTTGSPTTSTTETTEQGTDSETTVAADRTGGTLHWAQSAVASEGYDPHQVTRGFIDQYAFYDTLIRHETEDGSPALKPHLAADWTVESDTRFVFTLREGIEFHDGTVLDAEAAKFNFERLQKDFSTVKSTFTPVESVEVLDDLRFAIELEQPYGPFLDTLAGSSYMVSPEAAKEHGRKEFPQNPVGTGPWKYESHSSSETVLVRYDDYFREDEVPYLDRVVVKAIPENQTQVSALRNEDIDFLAGAPASHVDQLQSDDSVEVVPSQGLSQTMDFIGYNNATGPFSDVRVRRGISYGMNHEEARQFLDRVEAIDGPIRSHIMGNDPDAESLPHDPEKARSLLQEAGHADIEFTMLVREGHPTKKRWAELLKSQLSEIGVTMNIQQITTGALFTKLQNQEYDAHMLYWGGLGSLDPGQQLEPLFHSEGTYSFVFNYENDELDSLIDEGNSLVDRDRRAETFREAEKHIVDNVVGDFPFAFQGFVAHRDYVNDVSIVPSGHFPRLNEIWLSEDRR